MSAVISRASEHTNESPLASYCTVDDVRNLLAGVEPDDANSTLGAWLSEEAADGVITSYIEGRSLVRIHKLAGRDFDFHEDVDVVVDGSGSDTLRLGELGFLPLTDLSALTVLSTEQDLDDFVWYQDGRVCVAETYSTDYLRPRMTYPFPYGRQNVSLTISWGYEASPPAEIVQAQAMLVAAMVLQHVARSKTETPGMVGGIQQIQFEDFRVTNYQRSRFSADIAELTKEGEQLARSFKFGLVTGLRPNDTAASLEARENVFNRGRSDLG